MLYKSEFGIGSITFTVFVFFYLNFNPKLICTDSGRDLNLFNFFLWIGSRYTELNLSSYCLISFLVNDHPTFQSKSHLGLSENRFFEWKRVIGNQLFGRRNICDRDDTCFATDLIWQMKWGTIIFRFRCEEKRIN